MNLTISALRFVSKPGVGKNFLVHFKNASRPSVSIKLSVSASRQFCTTPLTFTRTALKRRSNCAQLVQKTALTSGPKPAAASEQAIAETIHPDGLTRYPSFSSPNGILRSIDWFGTIAFAMSATVTAGQCGMDMLGCVIVATVTSVGGGTLRDLFLGSVPVFWMIETEYIFLCLITSVITFFGWKKLDGILHEDDEILFWADTIGLGAFCVIGAQNGVRRGLAPIICVICGLLTATFGGVTRDTLCKRPVRILHANAETYGITAIGGASVYLAARSLNFNPTVRIFSGIGTTVAMRYKAHRDGKRLPVMDL